MAGEETYDLVIIGGGPAGSLLASLARRQDPDKRVLVLERERFPRHHVGESTIPSWRPILERAGVLGKLDAAIETRKVGTIFLWGQAEGESWTIDFRDVQTRCAPRGSFQVDRSIFDALVLDHAAELGAEVRQQAQVQQVGARVDGAFPITWTDAAGRHQARARFLADASGQARFLCRHWQIPNFVRDDMNNFAVYGYWEGSQLARYRYPVKEHERWTYIATTDDGWLWHIPISDTLTSVGLVTHQDVIPPRHDLEAFYHRNVRACAPIAELLATARFTQHPRAPRPLMVIQDWSWGCSRICGEGWFLLGDAAAFVDPILSSGLLIASSAASLVANALHTLWNDPEVDPALLRDSYQSTYTEMVNAYHRLARVWYRRNFHKSTWFWAAKRQRLQAGSASVFETDERAFLSLGLGSFSNALDAAVEGLNPRWDRPDIRIYHQHLFTDDIAERPDADLTEAMHAGEEHDARAAVKSEVMIRWRELLASHVRLRGCRWERRDGYHTDGFSSAWRRLRYLQVQAIDAVDEVDRVVFPCHEAAPDGLLPHLDGSRSLAAVIDDLLAPLPPGSPDRERLHELLFLQVVHLDLRRWLEASGAATPADTPPGGQLRLPDSLIEPLLAAADGAVLRCSVDLSGTRCTFQFDGGRAELADLDLVDAASADPRSVYRKTGTAGIAYRARTLSEPTQAMIADLVRAIESWEARDPDSVRRWWSDLRAFAGRDFRLSASDGPAPG